MENIEEVFNEILMYDVQEALKYSNDGFKKVEIQNIYYIQLIAI